MSSELSGFSGLVRLFLFQRFYPVLHHAKYPISHAYPHCHTIITVSGFSVLSRFSGADRQNEQQIRILQIEIQIKRG